MSKRVLHIVSGLDYDGAQKQLRLLAQGLPRDEFELRVCALACGPSRFSPQQEWDCPLLIGIPTVVIPSHWMLDPRAFWQLKSHVAELRPDLIHAWSPMASVYGFAAARACGITTFIAGHPSIDGWRSGLQIALDGVVTRRSRRVVVNSKAVGDYYVRHGTLPERLEVIPNGVGPPDRPTATRRQLLDALGLPEGSRLVCLVGRLDWQSRVKEAIWAIDLLKVIRDDVHLLVLGDGRRRDIFRRFSELCRNRDKVHFLGDCGDVSQIMPHCDVLWSTSNCVGRSDAILDGMAAGLPVVAADIPSTREMIVSGVTGYLAPVGDRAAFAKHTERLLNDESLRRRIGAAARERVVTDFSVDKLVARYAALYADVAGQPT